MTIKQQGGIFGRNPTFNDLTVEGTLTATGSTSYTSIDVDNINIDGNTISSTDTNGNIALDPNGTGLVTAASDVKLFSQKKVILNRADNATAAEINYQGSAVGLVFNDLNGEGFKFQLGGSDKVVFNYLGNIVVNSGNGIDFSATSGTGTSELFDDYEEGTWTPTFAPETGSFTTMTYSNNTGKYTKVGRLVTVHFNIFTSNVDLTGASGALRISGLPYTVTGEGGAGSIYSMYRFAFASDRVSPVGIGAISGTTYIQLRKDTVNAASAAGVDVTDLQTGAGTFRNAIQGTIVYEAS